MLVLEHSLHGVYPQNAYVVTEKCNEIVSTNSAFLKSSPLIHFPAH